MRKILILAALLGLSAGPSHADHCQDSTDWAGLAVPCHPADFGALKYSDQLASELAQRRELEKIRDRSEKPYDVWASFGCKRNDAQCMHKGLQELREKGLLKQLPAAEQ